MNKEEKENLRYEFLQDQYHEAQMKGNFNYFAEYMTQEYDFNKSVSFLDAMIEIKRVCVKYEQDFDELMDYVGELV